MVSFITTIFLSVVTAQLARASGISKRDNSCSSVHIFLARGTGETYPGRQGSLTSAICGKVADCDYEDIIYPASNSPTYCISVQGGKTNGTAQITSYAERCPDSKLILSGYSQGGQVITDILGGAGGYLFNECTQPSSAGLSRTTSPGDKIAAVIMFGDARHTASQPYNVLSGANDSSPAPRSASMLANLDTYANIMRSYCLNGDPVCASGNDGALHLTYLDDYTNDAASWAVSVLDRSTTTTTSSSLEKATASVTTSSLLEKATASLTTSSVEKATAVKAVESSAASTPAATSTPIAAAQSESSAASSSPSAAASSSQSSTPKSSGAGHMESSPWFLALTIVTALTLRNVA